MPYPDLLVLKLQIQNQWNALRRAAPAHASNALIAVTTLAILSSLLIKSTSTSWFNADPLLPHRVPIIGLVLLFSAWQILQQQRRLIMLQQNDWLACLTIFAFARQRYRQLRTLASGLIAGLIAALLMMVLQFGLQHILPTVAIFLALLWLLSIFLERAALRSIKITSNSTSPIAKSRVPELSESALAAKQTTNAVLPTHQVLAAWWQAGLPPSHIRARWWIFPLLAFPAGLHPLAMISFVLVGALLAILHHLQAAHVFLPQYSKLWAASPVAAGSIHRTAVRQFFRQTALAWLVVVLLISLLSIPWWSRMLIVGGLLITSGWQFHLSYACRFQPSRAHWLSLRYGVILIAIAALSLPLCALAALWQGWELWQLGNKTKDFE